MSRIMRRLILAAALFILLLPLIPLLLWSVTTYWRFPTVFPHIDGGYWPQLFFDAKLLAALGNSLMLTGSVVLISLLCSFQAAKYLGTMRFSGKRLVEVLLLVPTFIPPIAIVFGMQDVFVQLKLYSSFAGLLVAQLVFYLPYMTLLLSAVFENYDTDLEQQAASLGVGKLKVLLNVTLPAVRSGVVVCCMFCFIGSWSVYLLTNVIGSPQFKTMPTLIFPMISIGNNSYSTIAVAIILFIAPILAFLLLSSRALVSTAQAKPDSHSELRKGGLL